MPSKESNMKAKLELQEGLNKFKENAMKQGWEEDEVQEKISEVFENFPWYKFTPQPKTSWFSRIFKLMLYSFIIYLAFTAVLERNRRLKKNFNDFIHDYEIIYHETRILRFLTLPIFKFYDLSKFHNSECVIHNPFIQQEEINCELCENVFGIDTVIADDDLEEKIRLGSPMVVTGLLGYENVDVTFDRVKELFANNADDLDNNVCEIWLNKDYTKISDFFKLTEDEVKSKNISIAWRNCHTYGTRFYRRLFRRPDFVSNKSEISLEKVMMVLQKDQSVDLGNVGQGEITYLAQAQGSSTIEMRIPEGCSYNCTEKPLTTTLNKGQIFMYPSTFWQITLKSVSEDLSILYQSSYT